MHLRVICIAHERHLYPLRDQLRADTQHTISIDALTDDSGETLHLARAHRSDVVILDPSLDDGQLLSQWHREVGTTPVLICYSEVPDYAVDAFAAGALHYVNPEDRPALKDALDRAVARIVRYDRDGGQW